MTNTANEIVLIDLSSVAYPIWHMTQSDPDPNKASQQIVARVRALANDHPHVAVCCDSGRSFRKDIAESYKANRPPAEAMLHHQIDLAREQLQADGFPVWAVKGFEADDLIASAVAKTLETPDATALIVSADKDLLQLVGPRVRAMSARDGTILDSDAVYLKLGVRPEQVREYLMLVGDTSDNIKGAKDIGPKRAAELLAKYGTLEGIYESLDTHATQFTPALATNLREFQSRIVITRELVSLRSDAPLPFEEIAAERVAKEVATFAFDPEGDTECDDALLEDRPGPTLVPPPAQSAPTETPEIHAPATSSALAVRDADAILTPAPAEWERQLDPRSMKDARVLAKDLYDSRMFSAYGTPQGVLSTVMVGRELGLPAMASLRCIHNIEGRHALSAALMVAQVLKSGMAEYFEPVSFSTTEATYETLRKGARKPVTLTHTIEMARQSWPKTKPDWEKSFLASGWGRNPTDMLVARATSRLARMVYPDLLAGLYTPEELAELREQVA